MHQPRLLLGAPGLPRSSRPTNLNALVAISLPIGSGISFRFPHCLNLPVKRAIQRHRLVSGRMGSSRRLRFPRAQPIYFV